MLRSEMEANKVAEKTLLSKIVTDFDYLINKKEVNGCIIDSVNISKKIKKCMFLLINKNTDAISKIKIANFLCNKIYELFFMSSGNKKIITSSVTEIVYYKQEMVLPLRLVYLRFRNQEVSSRISIDLFNKGVRLQIDQIPYIQILKHIIRSEHATHNEIQNILTEFERLFENPTVSIYTKMEIADLFILNNMEQRGNEMLDLIRVFQQRGQVIKENDTVYSDSQNVHNNTVNESVLNACSYLIKQEQVFEIRMDNVRNELLEQFPIYTRSIESVLTRIEIDTSRFRSGIHTFSLYELFSSLWNYINKHKHKTELFKRLVEEISSMALYCATGHLSRFINVIQGYTEDPSLHIKISDKSQIKSVVSTYLDKLLFVADEKITDSIIENDKNPFYKFISTSINLKIEEWIKEYGEIQEHIISAVEKYSRWNYWTIKDNILKLVEG
jgi:hypothetical protein